DGKMVKDALENAARYFLSCAGEACSKSPLINSSVIGFNYDMAQGVEYEIDLTQPEGRRIRNLRGKGSRCGRSKNCAWLSIIIVPRVRPDTECSARLLFCGIQERTSASSSSTISPRGGSCPRSPWAIGALFRTRPGSTWNVRHCARRAAQVYSKGRGEHEGH